MRTCWGVHKEGILLSMTRHAKLLVGLEKDSESSSSPITGEKDADPSQSGHEEG